MKNYIIMSDNGLVLWIGQAESAAHARDLCAQAAGFEDESDQRNWAVENRRRIDPELIGDITDLLYGDLGISVWEVDAAEAQEAKERMGI